MFNRKILSRFLLSLSLLLCTNTIYIKADTLNNKNIHSLAEATGLKDIPKLSSKSAIIIDSDSGAVLLGKHIHTKRYPASITKVMTVLLALENGNLDDIIKCSKNAVMSIERGSSHIGMKVDEELNLRDALHAILLCSANEVSNAVGEYVAGDLKSFAKMMTNRAKSLGCRHTHFVNTNGLHDDKHYTTAYDMALIFKEAMKFDEFREIIMTRQSYVPETNLTDEKRYLNNSNQLILKQSKFYYDKCTGGKTGFTKKALHTLINSASNEDLNLISVVLRSRQRFDKWNDTIKMFDYCFEHFYNVKLNSDDGDGSFEALKLLKDENGKFLISRGSILNYEEENASITLPKDADFSEVTLKAKEIANSDTNKKRWHLTYYYNDFKVGECHILETLKSDNIANINATTMTQNSNINLKDAKNINNNLQIFIIIIGLGVTISALISVVFLVIRKRHKNENYIGKIKNPINKYNLDKSLFKRH